MNILINASEIKQGGGIQVTDSICRSLNRYVNHKFYVVLNSSFKTNCNYYQGNNVTVYNYDLQKQNLKLLLTGRDGFLDNIISANSIDIVLCVFGPSLWKPRCLTITGFARAHLVLPESPYYKTFSMWHLFKERLYNRILFYYFNRSTDVFFTENPMITNRVERLFKKKTITISNYYNQVFDNSDLWVKHQLPTYKGITLLTISSYYPHKNLSIAFDILNYLESIDCNQAIRFVYTVSKEEFPRIPEKYKNNFVLLGKVNIQECPSLYEQCDIVFQPTLLECFTATYPEAMRMKKPIVTSDLEFARGICGNAAAYYKPADGKSAAEVILKVAMNKELSKELVNSGLKRLTEFDNYNQRIDKIIKLLEETYTLQFTKYNKSKK